MMLTFHRQKLHKYIYIAALLLLVFSIPLSNFLLSISQFILIINWLIEGNFNYKWTVLRKRYDIILFASVFFVYALGIIQSSDVSMALERAKNAIPLIILPIIIGSSIPLSLRNHKLLLLTFCVSAIISAAIGYLKFNLDPAASNYREISYFMNSIRLALLIDMAIAILIYLIYSDTFIPDKWNIKILYILGVAFLTAFLFLMKSLTGIGTLLMLITYIGFVSLWKLKNRFVKISLITIFIVLVVGGAVFSTAFWLRNFTAAPVNHSQIEYFTKNNRAYTHDFSSRILENGHYLNLYICDKELAKEWNQVSNMSIDSMLPSKVTIHETLVRYLTSLGLRKDSASVHQLTRQDIGKIEKGIPNYRFTGDFGQRLYESLWEIHIYLNTGYVKHHSFGQRIAFYQSGFMLFLKSPWFGTGSGDVFSSMVHQSASMKFGIDPNWEGKPHNQFLFFLIAFGITGTIWILSAWCIPLIHNKTNNYMLTHMFLITMAISMSVLDTLEGYQSIVFFAFFYSLFVFAKPAPSPK